MSAHNEHTMKDAADRKAAGLELDHRRGERVEIPKRPGAENTNGHAGAPGNDNGAAPGGDWQPTEADPISGLPQLSVLILQSRARYLELAKMPIVYTWRDIIVAGTIAILAGSPSSGKTTLAYLYLCARAAKRGVIILLGREVFPAAPGQRLLIIEAEHSEPSAARKLIASLRLLQLDDSVLEGGRVMTIARKAVTLGSPAWHEIVRLIAAGLISDIIIDTIVRFAPADANDESEQVAIYDAIAQALEQAPAGKVPTCLLIAHTRKGAVSEDLEGVSGSTQRVGQADTVMLAEATREGSRVVSTKVTVPKLREDPGDRWPLPHSFAIREGRLVQELALPTAPAAADKKATADARLAAEAAELAVLVVGLPNLGTVDLRRAVRKKLGWGNSRFERVKELLCQGSGGVRLVDGSAHPNVCKWVIEPYEPTTPESEVEL